MGLFYTRYIEGASKYAVRHSSDSVNGINMKLQELNGPLELMAYEQRFSKLLP